MMTLEEMGALLREERERQGVSLEKAAVEIKISKKYLIALEEGQTGELPHPVYAKGFVKNYARLLGLDPEEMGAVLSNHYAVDDDQLREGPGYDVRESAPRIKERKISHGSAPSSGGFRPSLWLVLPLILVFAGVAWFFFAKGGVSLNMDSLMESLKSRFEVQAPEPAKPAKPVSEQPAPARQAAKEQPAKVETAPEAKPEPAPAIKAEAAPEPAAPIQRDLLATGNSPAAPAPKISAEAEISPEKLAAEAQFAASGKQVVDIDANQPATVEVATEDGQKRAFTLVKGQRLSLRFNDKVSVRFQQAPSVSVKLNGKDYPLDGGRADGKSLTFP